MNLKVIGAGVFMADELAAFPMPPAWRKATRNMIMATSSIEKAVRQVPSLEVAGNSEIGLILGSSSGELETSADFLTTWSKSKMARPVLFQNSLHNATTGFATIHFKITGPSITMSALDNLPTECVEMAAALLSEKACSVCIVTLNEAHKTLANWIGETSVREGACSLILTSEDFAKESAFTVHGNISLASLRDLNYKPSGRHVPLVSIDDSGFFGLAREWGARP